MIQQPLDRYTAVKEVKTSGDTARLAAGQVALAFESRMGERGKAVVDPTQPLNFPEKERFVVQAGSPFTDFFGGQPQKPMSTFPFDKSAIVEVGVSAPNTDTPIVDKVILGYDGVDVETAPVMYPGETRTVFVEVSGQPVEMLAYPDGIARFQYTLVAPLCSADECTDCDPCAPVDMMPLFEQLYGEINETRLSNGGKLGDIIDLHVIKKCSTSPAIATEDVLEFQITVPDGGTTEDLQRVQATANREVTRVSGGSGVSTYSVLSYPDFPTTLTPLKIKKGDILANCDTCPTDYTVSNIGGVLYSVMFAPSKISAATAVSSFPGTKNGNATKYSNTKTDKGQVDIIVTEAIALEDLDTYMATAGISDVITRGEVSTMCTSTVAATYNWVQMPDPCKIAQVEYFIELGDKECGTTGSRLAELQASYPYNNVTLVGQYGECMSQYKCEVYTNNVCSDCGNDSGFYTANRPNDYQGAEWHCPVSAGYSGCKMGIVFEGKFLKLIPNECFMDTVPTYFGSTRIKVAGGGNQTNTIANPTKDMTPWSVKTVNAANEISHMGFNLLDLVSKDTEYFLGEKRSKRSIERFFKGEVPLIDLEAQYVDYWVTLAWNQTRAYGCRQREQVKFHYLAKLGEHQPLEDMINTIAQIGELPAVSADASL